MHDFLYLLWWCILHVLMHKKNLAQICQFNALSWYIKHVLIIDYHLFNVLIHQSWKKICYSIKNHKKWGDILYRWSFSRHLLIRLQGLELILVQSACKDGQTDVEVKIPSYLIDVSNLLQNVLLIQKTVIIFK